MVIGTLGSGLVFEVSDERAMALQEMSRDTAGRWASHEAMGAKPKAEFLGPDNQTISLTVYLSAALGVRPRAMLETLEAMAESGTAEYLIIGNRPVGKNPFRITGCSETWGHIYGGGQLARATVALTLEEYT